MPPYRVEYLCPRQSPYWQRFGGGFFNRAGTGFASLELAKRACNGLLFQYHAARVLNAAGTVEYSI